MGTEVSLGVTTYESSQIFIVQIQWNTLVSKSKEEKKNLINTPKLNLWLLRAYSCTLVMIYPHTQISEKFQIVISPKSPRSPKVPLTLGERVNSFINVVF